MRLKKFLISLSGKGQVTLEYFIIFCLIAAITIIGGSALYTGVGRTTNSFMNESIAAMNQSDLREYPATVSSSTSSYSGGYTTETNNNNDGQSQPEQYEMQQT